MKFAVLFSGNGAVGSCSLPTFDVRLRVIAHTILHATERQTGHFPKTVFALQGKFDSLHGPRRPVILVIIGLICRIFRAESECV